MRALNEAFEGAALYNDMMQKVLTKDSPSRRQEILAQSHPAETRRERRARERAERFCARNVRVRTGE